MCTLCLFAQGNGYMHHGKATFWGKKTHKSAGTNKADPFKILSKSHTVSTVII